MEDINKELEEMLDRINDDEKRYEELTIEANAKLLSEKIEEFLSSSGKAKYYMSYYVDGKQIYEYLDENLNKVQEAGTYNKVIYYCRIKRGDKENYIGIYDDGMYNYYLADSSMRKVIKMVNKRSIHTSGENYLVQLLKYSINNKLVELDNIYEKDELEYGKEDIEYERCSIYLDAASQKYNIHDNINDKDIIKGYTGGFLYRNYIIGTKEGICEVVSTKDLHLLAEVSIAKDNISDFEVSVYDNEKIIRIDTAKKPFEGFDTLFDPNFSIVIYYDKEKDEAKIKFENVDFFMDLEK